MKEFLRLSLTLCVIAFVAALLLAYVNFNTEPVIAENTQIREENARIAVLPEADSFTEVEDGIYKADNGAGYVVKTLGSGYGGTDTIVMMVGFDSGFNLTGLEITDHSETPGLGAKAKTDPSFAAQFAGKETPITFVKSGEPTNSEIVAITGATRTTRGVVNAVNAARLRLDEYISGEGETE